MREPRWVKVGSYIVLVVAAVIAIFPAIWVFVSSFKVESEVFSTKVEAWRFVSARKRESS